VEDATYVQSGAESGLYWSLEGNIYQPPDKIEMVCSISITNAYQQGDQNRCLPDGINANDVLQQVASVTNPVAVLTISLFSCSIL
jgi:hypothetical protein